MAGGVVIQMKIEFPIFILEKDSGDISKFENIYEMQAELERIDIENNEYEAWDRNAVPLKLSVQEPVWLRVEQRSTVPELSVLREAIKRFVGRAGVSLQDESNLDTVGVFSKALTEVLRHKAKR